jgi:shikimate kinase
MANAQASIVVTGFMGTGKSSVGHALSERLDMEFVDTDAVIEAEYGPISEIFATQGEEAFREIERSVVSRVAQQPGRIIATGGGTILDPQSAQALASSGSIYSLVASPHEIVRRVQDPSNPERPLLDGHDPLTRVTKLLTERLPVYGQFPQIRTDGRSPDAIAAEIANDAANRGVVPLPKIHKRKGTSSGVAAWKVGAISFVVVAGIAALVLFLTGGETDVAAPAARDPEPPTSDLPVDAPEADEYFDIVLIDAVGPRVQETVREYIESSQNGEFGFDGGQEVVEGTARHILSAGTSVGTVEIYQYDVVAQWPGQRPEELTCTAEVAPNGIGQGFGGNCQQTQFMNNGTQMMWGGIQTGRNWIQTIGVANAPDDGVWLIVEVANGFTAISSVQGGYGYTELGEFGEPRRIAVLDADHAEVWSERMF